MEGLNHFLEPLSEDLPFLTKKATLQARLETILFKEEMLKNELEAQRQEQAKTDEKKAELVAENCEMDKELKKLKMELEESEKKLQQKKAEVAALNKVAEKREGKFNDLSDVLKQTTMHNEGTLGEERGKAQAADNFLEHNVASLEPIPDSLVSTDLTEFQAELRHLENVYDSEKRKIAIQKKELEKDIADARKRNKELWKMAKGLFQETEEEEEAFQAVGHELTQPVIDALLKDAAFVSLDSPELQQEIDSLENMKQKKEKDVKELELGEAHLKTETKKGMDRLLELMARPVEVDSSLFVFNYDLPEVPQRTTSPPPKKMRTEEPAPGTGWTVQGTEQQTPQSPGEDVGQESEVPLSGMDGGGGGWEGEALLGQLEMPPLFEEDQLDADEREMELGVASIATQNDSGVVHSPSLPSTSAL